MIILICGLPRSGKTTYSKQYEGIYKIYHLDDYGCPLKAYIRINKKINSNEDLVIDGIYNRAETRRNLIIPYKEKKVCIWMNTPIEIKKTRRGYNKYCEYPFEPPTYSEGWNEIIIIEGDKQTILPKK